MRLAYFVTVLPAQQDLQDAEAAGMVKDLNSDANKSAGWTVNAHDDLFNGKAALSQDPSQTLADFLGA